jgi:hypothetical protein
MMLAMEGSFDLSLETTEKLIEVHLETTEKSFEVHLEAVEQIMMMIAMEESIYAPLETTEKSIEVHLEAVNQIMMMAVDSVMAVYLSYSIIIYYIQLSQPIFFYVIVFFVF